jgi:Na+-translocating ferredoxin:NAD+ oxidoreductase RnfD subunit
MGVVYKRSYRYWIALAWLLCGIALFFAERAHILVPIGMIGMSVFTFPFIVDWAEKKYPTSTITTRDLYYLFVVLLFIGTFLSD